MDIGLFIFADLFAVLTGTQSGILREILIEETFVMIADQPGNFVDGQIGIFQKLLRLIDPELNQIGRISLPRVFLDQIIENNILRCYRPNSMYEPVPTVIFAKKITPDASSYFDDTSASQLMPFDRKKAVDFDGAYLAGFFI